MFINKGKTLLKNVLKFIKFGFVCHGDCLPLYILGIITSSVPRLIPILPASLTARDLGMLKYLPEYTKVVPEVVGHFILPHLV